jgi:hypothetical protein
MSVTESKVIMNVLVIDVGGTHVKVLATGQDVHREFKSGPALTPKRMISGVCRAGNNAKAFVGGFRLWKKNGNRT